MIPINFNKVISVVHFAGHSLRPQARYPYAKGMVIDCVLCVLIVVKRLRCVTVAQIIAEVI